MVKIVDLLRPVKVEEIDGKSTIVDESNSDPIYVGKAEIGSDTNASVWTIQRIVEDSGITTITWATGSWDNRASLTYS